MENGKEGTTEGPSAPRIPPPIHTSTKYTHTHTQNTRCFAGIGTEFEHRTSHQLKIQLVIPGALLKIEALQIIRV